MPNILKESKRILNYLITGLTGGLVYACIEYFARRNSDDPQTLIPLMIRAGCVGAIIFGTVIIFETWSQRWFAKSKYWK